MAIETEDLAKLVMGFAKAQKAVVMGLAQRDPEVAMRVTGYLQGAAGLGQRPQHEPTLEDLPSRVLLQVMGDPRPGQAEAARGANALGARWDPRLLEDLHPRRMRGRAVPQADVPGARA